MAKKGLPGKYIRAASGDMKKAWRAYKASKTTRKKKKSNPKSTKTVAKRKSNPSNPKRKTKRRSYRSRGMLGKGMLGKVIRNARKAIVPVGTGVLGAGATAMAVRALPLQTNVSRGLTQFILGVAAAALATKRQGWLTAAGIGSMFAGGFALSKGILPESVSPMVAGNGPQRRIPYYETPTTEEIGVNFEQPQNPVNLGLNMERPFMGAGFGEEFLTPAHMI